MNIRQFLKLDLRRIILMTVLLASSFVYVYEQVPSPVIDYNYAKARGFPISVWFYEPLFAVEEQKFSYSALILNTLFWYFISSLIIWIYDKLKKKS